MKAVNTCMYPYTPIPLGIKVAPIVKRRGRPRGHELTSIGLPAKKAKKDVDKKPCSFSRLNVSAKEEGKQNYWIQLMYPCNSY